MSHDTRLVGAAGSGGGSIAAVSRHEIIKDHRSYAPDYKAKYDDNHRFMDWPISF